MAWQIWEEIRKIRSPQNTDILEEIGERYDKKCDEIQKLKYVLWAAGYLVCPDCKDWSQIVCCNGGARWRFRPPCLRGDYEHDFEGSSEEPNCYHCAHTRLACCAYPVYEKTHLDHQPLTLGDWRIQMPPEVAMILARTIDKVMGPKESEESTDAV
jgi:hypothetical protein